MSQAGVGLAPQTQEARADSVDLRGRAAIITGASQGLGLEIAETFMRAGADILVCARDERTLLAAERALLGMAREGQRVVAIVADVSKEDQVIRLAKRAIDTFGQVHALVNNAGVYGPKGVTEDIDWGEWIAAVEINLFGSVLMCRAILPHFKSMRYGKIVQLSGGGATNPLPRLSAYAASKAAVVRFAESLALEAAGFGIDVNSIAPGPLNTRFLDEVLEAGREKVGDAFYERAVKQKAEGGAPLEAAAALAAFLASAASDGITGKLISAIWDPWRSLKDHIDDLRRTDVYSLRRIVPADRDLSWG